MNLRTARFLCAAVAVIALALTGCSQADSSGKDVGKGPEGLAEAGTLHHCIALSYPPLEYRKNGSDGEIVGWDVDSVRAIAKKWGVDYKVTAMAFDGLIPGLDTGKCDVVWSGMYINEQRTQVTDASPVLHTGSQIVVRSDRKDEVNSREDICGLRIAAQVASEDLTHLKELSKECESNGNSAIKISSYPGTLDALPNLRDGRLDGLIDTTVLAAELVRRNKDMAMVDGIFELDYWFGAFTRKGSPLGGELRDALVQVVDDGTLTDLAKKYNLNPKHVATRKVIDDVSTVKA